MSSIWLNKKEFKQTLEPGFSVMKIKIWHLQDSDCYLYFIETYVRGVFGACKIDDLLDKLNISGKEFVIKSWTYNRKFDMILELDGV